MKTTQTPNRKTLKARIADIGEFNSWKGCIRLYFTVRETRELARLVPHCEDMTLREIYNAL